MDILEAFEKHEQAPKLEQAKKNCGNDMLKTMQYVFPILVQIQMDVIKKYGFSDDRKGIVQFTQEIKVLEQEDETIMNLHGQIRSYFMPPINITNEALL
ncbi:protein C10 isoform X2 [Bemisia tabaci]|nr:PREDICTED: protein C10 isoform X2 [Bemisia tabaci]